MPQYNYVCVGAGLFSSVFAYKMKQAGKRVLVVEKRDRIGGNCWSEKQDGIEVHKYGPHIFHTSSKELWDFVNTLTPFRPYRLKVLSSVGGRLLSFPINFETLQSLYPWVHTPEQARELLTRERIDIPSPRNLEEHCLAQIGWRLYKTFIYGYTKKQWGREPKDLPASIIKRIPVRLIADSSYYYDTYEGMPEQGYGALFRALLDGIEVRTGVDYLQHRGEIDNLAERTLFTGPIDAFFDFKFGELAYRSLRFSTERYDVERYQPSAIVTYPDERTAFTRACEWKAFHPADVGHTLVTREYPCDYRDTGLPMYPVRDEENSAKHREYAELAGHCRRHLFGGRLSDFQYQDMHVVVKRSLALAERELQRELQRSSD